MQMKSKNDFALSFFSFKLNWSVGRFLGSSVVLFFGKLRSAAAGLIWVDFL